MKFTLVFDGDLPSRGDCRDKWRIRKQLHPQLQQLWETHVCLKDLADRRFFHMSGAWFIDGYHLKPRANPPRTEVQDGEIDLCERIKRGGREFLPLVRNSLALKCGLKIHFLRQEEPGRIVSQTGDLDNRLKTLFDALSVPDAQQIVDDNELTDPICCLMEDDALVAGLDIETHRLLAQPDKSKHWVRLLIEVDVRVTQTRYYNQPFLGD